MCSLDDGFYPSMVPFFVDVSRFLHFAMHITQDVKGEEDKKTIKSNQSSTKSLGIEIGLTTIRGRRLLKGAIVEASCDEGRSFRPSVLSRAGNTTTTTEKKTISFDVIFDNGEEIKNVSQDMLRLKDPDAVESIAYLICDFERRMHAEFNGAVSAVSAAPCKFIEYLVVLVTIS
jgi:hypothetical protein